jgi:hypothetical protein
MLDAAAAILPAVRNAAAHEDAWWDGAAGVLRVGNAAVTIDDVEDATARAYALMSGAECAWACARGASPEFALMLDTEDPEDGLPAINQIRALNHFGTNGLLVASAHHEGSTLVVALETLAIEQVNPCIQAVMWASRHLVSTERFRIVAPGLAHAALDLQRPALDATFVVWQEARAFFTAMPTSTFLPAVAWARLTLEMPDESARATAWLALNDALHAYDETHDEMGPASARAARLSARLSLIATAVAATMTVLPTAACEPLHEVLDLTDEAAHWSSSIAEGRTGGPSSALEGRARALHATWSSPAAFPTVDLRSVDDMTADEQADA